MVHWGTDETWYLHIVHPATEALVRSLASSCGGVHVFVPELAAHGGWAVSLADGRVPLLVRDFGHAIGVAVHRSRAWTQPLATYDARALREITGVVRTWEQSRDPEECTLLELALDLRRALVAALGDRWSLSLPGTPDPTEGWIHPADHDAASIGVFDGRALAWVEGVCREVFVPQRSALADAHEPIVRAAREQLALHARNVVLAARLESTADELTRRLAAHFRLPFTWRSRLRPSHASTIRVSIDCPARASDVMELRAEHDVVRAHAGLVGEDGWDGELGEVEPHLWQITRAIEHSLTALTFERLVPGRVYRVLSAVDELIPGELVRFVRFDDLDNHYGRACFETLDAEPRQVRGDYSDPRHGPLAEAHRVLVELPDYDPRQPH